MSDYHSQHARNHGRPMDYTDSGSGAGLWIVLGLLALITLPLFGCGDPNMPGDDDDVVGDD